jgi:Domain of unknown function (DUF6484)
LRTKAPKTVTVTVATATAENETPSAFQALLERQVQTGSASNATPTSLKAEGIAIGTLVQVNADGGHVQVQIPSLGLGPLPAVSMVALGPQHLGQSLALGFEGANAHRPIVLGLMMQAQAPMEATAPAPEAASQAVRVTQNGHRVVVEAHTELELRCGEAVILLSEDGHIQIRGAYVTTHASASNRIRGGSVQIN